MKKLYFLLLITISILNAAKAQEYSYDKEKIYIQTDHVFYAPGGTIFYKLYLVKGENNKPSNISNIVYAEILGPSGAIVEKQTYQPENGYTEGSYTLAPQATGGIYKLRAYTSWMRNEKDSTRFTKSFTVQNIIAPRVLMHLDFDKKGYGPADIVDANFSMRSLDDAPVIHYTGEFTVSLNGTQQQTGSFTTQTDGKAKLTFALPKDLNTTDGLLNITVNYHNYTESISRSIPITLNKIDCQFLPEGGTFITGLSTNIAFKAINEFGKPVDVKGVIRDNKGQVVASFDSYKFGMGSFPFNPRKDQTYTATIISPANITRQYPLPQAAPNGVVMNVTNNTGTITVKCNSTTETAVRLIGRTKGITYYSQDLTLKRGGNDIHIKEELFPAGIAQFTLYSDKKLPIAERLSFLNIHKQLNVFLSTDKQHYLPREKVRMTLITKDEQGQPIPSNFSLSIVDDKLWTMADDRQDNILSSLQLSSELRGPIEEPSFYFKKNEPKAAEALNLLMLTNGYRYFDLIDDVRRNGELKFTPDEGNIVSGTITNENDQPVPATIFLINNIASGRALKEETGKDGQFYFSKLLQGGSYLVIARSSRKGENIKIRLDQVGIGHNPQKGAEGKQLRIDDRFMGISKPINKGGISPMPPQPKAVSLGIDLNTTRHLDEVVVIGYGVTRKRDVVGSVTIINGAGLKAAPVNNVLMALEGKVAGVQITQAANPGETVQIRIRGANSINNGNEPLIVIDGVPQKKYDLNNINANDIDNITVLKDATATGLFGSRAANGVILITTKTTRNDKLRFNITGHSQYFTQQFHLDGPAYTVARRFYAPEYRSTVTNQRDDFRETIYWNPVVQTDKEGKAIVEFYNSDATTTFRAIAEGIGYNGKLGRADTTYVAKAAMSVDVKIPPYLTVGDQALIPVVIKNNSAQKLEANIAIAAPNSTCTGKFENTVTLDTGASKQLLIPLTAIAPTTGNINISITSDLSNETIVLPIMAAAKGFPVIETFSGNTTTKHQLTIDRFVPGSLHAKFRLYKDLEGQLMDGIESMLREPYGCFEQTSSSTYPNIFILKYLRQAGKSDPAIEKKALSYIGNGYEKLIGFETSENGFEWFGHVPAHAALTAYGLLEFTDMQEFLDVDKSMLKRTKEFLLKRRDGKGGFQPPTGGLDHFAAVPDKIANIYIVYAMTQAGFGNEIKPEYAAAVRKALGSDDAYQLAMMALAASNMKNAEDYKSLMDQLNANYRKTKLSSETSVVNSRDISLHVETMALYTLALLRDSHPDMATAANGISTILANKSYYGFGSTQGTILALQAITEFTKQVGEQVRSSDIHLAVNDHLLNPADSIPALLHQGLNTFSLDYPDKQTGLPYNLEIAYQTLTPPNSAKADLSLNTTLNNPNPAIGETVRMTISVHNKKDTLQPMAIAKIGIPAGLSLQPWQLRELTEKKQVAYYELFDNYLVLYWMGFAPNETKNINLDLKAEIPGTYKAKASNVYLYYTPEHKHWNEGLEVEIHNNSTQNR